MSAELSARELEFLRESNAIEEIENIVFRAGERVAFYAAHRSKPAMKLFVASKLREVAISPFTGELLYRVGGDLAADILENANHSYRFVLEGHSLIPRLLVWQQQADEKDRARGLVK